MKKTLIIIAILSIGFINFNCKSNSASLPTKSLPDTTRVIGVFVDGIGREVRHDVIYRVILDSIKVDTNNVMRNIVTKDSLYFIPVVDSARDKQTGKPLFDSTGKAIPQTYWIITPKERIWDSGIIVDSAISRFKKFMAQDTTKQK